MMKILTVIGTRPEAVKMAPVVAALTAQPSVESLVVATAQHREMMDQVLEIFDIAPDFDLNVMEADQSPTDVLAEVLQHLQPVLQKVKPNWLLVQGDTTTVLGASIAAAYSRVRVGHVEAGLRTHDRMNPFPEELNRVLADHIADLHFAPTETARAALLAEGIATESIHVTGNTVVDALQTIVQRPLNERLPQVPSGRKLLLVTAHRRENHGKPIRNILAALRELSHRDDVYIIYPVHRNPNIAKPAYEMLGAEPNVELLAPADYLTFVHLMGRAHLILTDSGGVQEEAPGLGVPVLVMREVTERPEAIEAGTARLVGTDAQVIIREAITLLDDPDAHAAMARAINPFGDGRAAQRIADILVHDK